MRYILIILFFIQGFNSQSQNSGYYYMYEFDQFAINKTIGDKEFLKELYQKIKFPEAIRKSGKDEIVKFLIISHGDRNVEIIPAEKPTYLHEYVISKLSTLESIQLKSNEKFMTEFTVNFDLEPFEKYDVKSNTIYITQYKFPIIRYHQTTDGI